MTTATETPAMTGKEIVDLTKKHTLFEWSAQSRLIPSRSPAQRAFTSGRQKGSASSISIVSLHVRQHRTWRRARVIQAIHEQAQTLAYANPFMATEPRARLGAKLAEITPGDIDTFLSPTVVLKRTKTPSRSLASLLDATRSWRGTGPYHGATAGADRVLTGDPRQLGRGAGHSGVFARSDPYHGIERGWESAETSLAMIEEAIAAGGPADHRGIHP